MNRSILEFLFGALLIAGLVFFAFSPALGAGFVWDDAEHFSEVSAMLDSGGLVTIWTQHDFYFPLTSTSYWLICQIWGLDPFPFHLINLMLHAMNAVFLWRIARRLGFVAPLLCAIIFALHPVQVQTVAWATELKNTQSGCFYLISILFYLRFMENSRRFDYAVSLMLALFAMLSKTSTVTLPFAIMLIHFWMGGGTTRSALNRISPYFALSLALGLLTVLLHRNHVDVGGYWNESLPERFLLAARGIWFYLGKLAFPSPLVFVYERWNLSNDRLLWVFSLVLSCLGFTAISVFPSRANRKVALFAALYFVFSLLPVLNFFRMYYTRYAYVADHWQYLASMGAIPLLIGLLHRISRRVEFRFPDLSVQQLKWSGVVALCALLVFRTFSQTLEYRDFDTLLIRTLEKNPKAELAYSNLGKSYLLRGDYMAAREILVRGAEVAPDNMSIKNNLAFAIMNQYPDEAVEMFREVIAKDPTEITAYNNLAIALGRTGRIAEAIQALEEGLRLHPDNEVMRENLELLRSPR